MVILGVVLLVAGVAGFFMAHLMRRNVHAMIGTETLTVAELDLYHRTALEVSGPGGFRRVSEVIGTTQPAPNGLLASQLTQTPCVWHRHEIIRRYRKVRHDSEGRRHTSEHTETVSKFTSDTPILVADQTGSVLVRPSGLRSDAIEQVLSRFERHSATVGQIVSSMVLGGWYDGDTIGYEYKEWVVRPGVRLYVHGEASDQSGQLVFGKPAKGPFIVSNRTEEELRRSSGVQQKVYAFGGLAVVILGLVLVVVGAVRGH
ncbi:helicase [Solihabitans fulvus]|uniref:RING-type E3 ubiquitin transferase n=1 Tax=Solihabitans fulvus TaxID=1892852 RepID=A0A5B2X174_9PSEU|nr:GIDE domain-containing protein [Solihabitans fulvus]KAA2256929.1 helicase [Solihabitans fulvus]